MSEKENLSKQRQNAQQRNEDFFEQLGPEFGFGIETTIVTNLKEVTIFQNHDHGTTFLIEMRFKTWKQAEAHKHIIKYLSGPWYDSGIYKEDIYRIGKSLFLRKLLF